jgi:ectoine hydroxylase-related dioxygenase (phytanoyl-CoA dioxygenase family)
MTSEYQHTISDQPFDENFYLQAYPIVARELARGIVSSPLEHYQTIGRGRGYLASPQGKRFYNASATASSFGGLWTDQSDAAEIVQHKLDAREINSKQAQQLRDWMRDGYIVLKNAISDRDLTAAAADLDRAYTGGFDKALFECHKLDGKRNIGWQSELRTHNAKALDLHHFSIAMRGIMFSPVIATFLKLIFESNALATQTLGFWRGSGQEGHQDSAYVPFTLPRNFAASWIALEDVTIGAGELFYYVGSHKFPDFLYGGKYKSIAEAERLGYSVQRSEIERHVASLRERADKAGIGKTVFAAKRGDALIWHADLVHGGNPVSRTVTRKSFVTHYCPQEVSPLFSERMATDLFDYKEHLMTSHLYDIKGHIKSGLLNSLFRRFDIRKRNLGS